MAEFDCFVVFAEMRTGSNFLEANINAFDGLTCHGEAFNPHFIGYPNSEDILGVTQAERDRDPLALLGQIRKATPGALGGFRYFHDHDPRVLETLLGDARIARQWQIYAYPSYYVLDSQHRIARRDIGYSSQLGLLWRAWTVQ